MKWKKNFRTDGRIEYVCECGVGHTSYDSAVKVAARYNHEVETWLVHGCCGCCSRDDFPGKEGMKDSDFVNCNWCGYRLESGEFCNTTCKKKYKDFLKEHEDTFKMIQGIKRGKT